MYVNITTDKKIIEAIYIKNKNPQGLALLLHPHPLYGGNMHSKVLYTLAKTLKSRKIDTLRINFRGVGKSTGVFDNAIGEVQDAKIALQYALNSTAYSNVFVMGLSFGAVIALKLYCLLDDIQHFVLINPPSIFLEQKLCTRKSNLPSLIIGSGDDKIVPKQTLDKLVVRIRNFFPNLRYVTVDNVDHFFTANLIKLQQQLDIFLNNLKISTSQS